MCGCIYVLQNKSLCRQLYFLIKLKNKPDAEICSYLFPMKLLSYSVPHCAILKIWRTILLWGQVYYSLNIKLCMFVHVCMHYLKAMFLLYFQTAVFLINRMETPSNN